MRAQPDGAAATDAFGRVLNEIDQNLFDLIGIGKNLDVSWAGNF